MTLLDENTRMVINSAELKDAVEDMDVDYIYIGANINLDRGITIPSSKQRLTFDGLYDGVTYTFTDMDNISLVNTLGIRTQSNIILTFKNMVMVGHNYYGIPYVAGDAWPFIDNVNVSVIYDHVTYNGPQIAYNPDGLSRIVNCDITISYPRVPARAQEVGEVNRVEFEGVNTINHRSMNNAVFWFRGSTVGTAYLRVLSNAQVIINTNNYFMFNMVPLTATTQNPVRYEILPLGSLTINSDHGISLNSNHRVSSFLVDANGSFNYIQGRANGTNSSLYANGDFIVSEGASVYMQADFTAAQPLINFITGTIPAQLSVNNPKSFVLYDSTNAPITLASSATRNFILRGGQINYWDIATPFPEAGEIGDSPKDQWFRSDWSYFDFTGNITSMQTNVTGTSLTPEEQDDLPPIGNLVFGSARVISIGDLPIVADPAIDNGRPITGVTEPGADLLITYTIESVDYSFEAKADENGRFISNPLMSIPAGIEVTVKANIPFLITTIKLLVAITGDITIEDAPEYITIMIPPISKNPVILPRREPEEPVIIVDTRVYGTQWKLFASITGPLKTESGETLENAVIFKNDDGDIVELSNVPFLVYTGESSAGTTNVFWSKERGILVRVNEPIRSGVEYSTHLVWELQPS